MSAKTSIIGQLGRMAIIRQNAKALATGGTKFWDRVDGAADETYENRVKGSRVTELDSALFNGAVFGSVFRNWVEDHIAYFRSDLNLSGTNLFESYLASIMTRCPYDAAELLVDAMGSMFRLSSTYVYPKGVRVSDNTNPASSGMHEFMYLTGTTGNPTQTVVDGALNTSLVRGAAILAINKTATTSATSLVVTVTLQDGSTKDLNVTLAGSGQYKQTYVGAQAINTGGAAAGQKVIPLAATSQFKAGEYVLVHKNDSTQEIAKIVSITDNTSITLESNLLNSYAANDFVFPLYTNVVWKSGTVADTKVIGFYAMPDRLIEL